MYCSMEIRSFSWSTSISSLPSLNYLVQLESLHLSGNPLQDLQAIKVNNVIIWLLYLLFKSLVGMVSLANLSFKDNVWIGCPLSLQENYSDFVILSLPQLHILDDVAINDTHRSQV